MHKELDDMRALNSLLQLILGHFAKFELRQVFEEWKRFWRIKSNIPDRNSEGSYKNLMSKYVMMIFIIEWPLT